MRSRLWNVLVIAAIGWAALIGGQLIAVGTKGGDANAWKAFTEGVRSQGQVAYHVYPALP